MPPLARPALALLLSLTAARADSGLSCGGYSGGKQTCCKTFLADVLSQSLGQVGRRGPRSFSVSSATCSTCGSKGYCPSGSSDITPLATRFFWACTVGRCVFGCHSLLGTQPRLSSRNTVTGDGGVSFTTCRQQLSGGGIAVIVILAALPTVCGVVCLLALLRRRRARAVRSPQIPDMQLYASPPPGYAPGYAQSPEQATGTPPELLLYSVPLNGKV